MQNHDLPGPDGRPSFKYRVSAVFLAIIVLAITGLVCFADPL